MISRLDDADRPHTHTTRVYCNISSLAFHPHSSSPAETTVAPPPSRSRSLGPIRHRLHTPRPTPPSPSSLHRADVARARFIARRLVVSRAVVVSRETSSVVDAFSKDF